METPFRGPGKFNYQAYTGKHLEGPARRCYPRKDLSFPIGRLYFTCFCTRYRTKGLKKDFNRFLDGDPEGFYDICNHFESMDDVPGGIIGLLRDIEYEMKHSRPYKGEYTVKNDGKKITVTNNRRGTYIETDGFFQLV